MRSARDAPLWLGQLPQQPENALCNTDLDERSRQLVPLVLVFLVSKL